MSITKTVSITQALHKYRVSYEYHLNAEYHVNVYSDNHVTNQRQGCSMLHLVSCKRCLQCKHMIMLK